MSTAISSKKYEKGDWCECESVWGYYPSTNDSLRELSDEAFGPEKWTSSDPKLPEPELTRAEWIKCMTEKELSGFLFETKEKIASMDQEELMLGCSANVLRLMWQFKKRKEKFQ